MWLCLATFLTEMGESCALPAVYCSETTPVLPEQQITLANIMALVLFPCWHLLWFCWPRGSFTIWVVIFCSRIDYIAQEQPRQGLGKVLEHLLSITEAFIPYLTFKTVSHTEVKPLFKCLIGIKKLV